MAYPKKGKARANVSIAPVTSIGKSLFLGLVSLFNARMLWLLIWPVLVSLVLWGAAALVFWVKAAGWIAAQLGRMIGPLTAYVPFDFSGITLMSAHIMLFVLAIPVVYLTALLILAIFGMDAMVDHVAERHYPGLVRKHGGGAAGSAWNAIVALCGLVLLFLATLPLLLAWPVWAVAQAAIMGWVNQKLLRYDALAAHASAAEMRTIFSAQRGRLYQLGLILGLAAYVPVIGIFAPLLFALAFIHFCLGALRDLRGTPVEGQVIEGEVVGTTIRPS